MLINCSKDIVSHKIFLDLGLGLQFVTTNPFRNILGALSKYVEGQLTMFVHLHHRGRILKSVHVLWGRPNSRQFLFEQQLIALHAKLMSSCDMRQSIQMQKLLQDLLSKNITCFPWRICKPKNLWFRVTPHQVAHRTIMRNLLVTIQLGNLNYTFDGRRQSSMYCKNSLIDCGGNRNVVKHVCKILPHSQVVEFSLTLHIKSIVLSYTSCLMVSSNHEHPLWISNFQQAQKSYHLDTVGPSVDVIPQKEIAGVWEFASYFKNLQKIVKLAMNISNYCDWRLQLLDIRFFEEDILEF